MENIELDDFFFREFGGKKNIAANMLAAKEKERNYIILQKNKECFMESVEKITAIYT